VHSATSYAPVQIIGDGKVKLKAILTTYGHDASGAGDGGGGGGGLGLGGGGGLGLGGGGGDGLGGGGGDGLGGGGGLGLGGGGGLGLGGGGGDGLGGGGGDGLGGGGGLGLGGGGGGELRKHAVTSGSPLLRKKVARFPLEHSAFKAAASVGPFASRKENVICDEPVSVTIMFD